MCTFNFHNIKLLRFVFQTIALLNIYRNPQNSSQSADGLRCKFIQVLPWVPGLARQSSVSTHLAAVLVSRAALESSGRSLAPARGSLCWRAGHLWPSHKDSCGGQGPLETVQTCCSSLRLDRHPGDAPGSSRSSVLPSREQQCWNISPSGTLQSRLLQNFFKFRFLLAVFASAPLWRSLS